MKNEDSSSFLFPQVHFVIFFLIFLELNSSFSFTYSFLSCSVVGTMDWHEFACWCCFVKVSYALICVFFVFYKLWFIFTISAKSDFPEFFHFIVLMFLFIHLFMMSGFIAELGELMALSYLHWGFQGFLFGLTELSKIICRVLNRMVHLL